MSAKWHTPAIIATAAVTAATAAFVVVAQFKKDKEVDARTLAERAGTLYREERYTEAADIYEKLQLDYPTSFYAKDAAAREIQCEAKALFGEARLLARSGRYGDAGDVLVKALALAPDDAEINYGVGWIYTQLALDTLAQAPYARGRMGEVVLMTKVYLELARSRFERCVQLDPKYSGGYRGLALYYIINEDYDAALAHLAASEKYARRPEDKVATGRMRVQVYLGQKKYDEAKAVLDALLTKFADRGDVYYSLAEYYLRKEKADPAEAKKALEVGLTKRFEDAGTRNQLITLLARLRLDAKDYDGALAVAADGLAADPFNEALLHQYMLTYGTRAMAGKVKSEK